MVGQTVFAARVGRRESGENILAITAAAMVFFNPHILWEVGFQLTLLLTLGLVYILAH